MADTIGGWDILIFVDISSNSRSRITVRSHRQQVNSGSIDEFTFGSNDGAPDFIIAAFTEWLSDYIAGGATFEDGQTLQYGYTLLMCRVQSRRLQLFAPDFQSMPINWVRDLGPALNIVAAHKYMPETFGFTPDIPTLTNTAIVGKRFDEVPMFASRLPPLDSKPNDSGWFIGSSCDEVDNNDPDQLRLMSLYEAMLTVPHVLDFLSLPVGCQVVFYGGSPVILMNEKELEIPKGSYLDRRMNGNEP